MEVIYGDGGLANFATVIDLRNPDFLRKSASITSQGVRGRLRFPIKADGRHRAESFAADHDHLAATRRTLRRGRQLPGHRQLGRLLAGHLLIWQTAKTCSKLTHDA